MSELENAAPDSNIFEAELGRQILVSERERASLQALIGVALLLIIGVVKAIHVATANPWPAFNVALTVVAILVVYELAMRQLFDRYLRQDRKLPPVIRYLNVAIETSFPTILLAAFGNIMRADVALTSAVVLGYFFFIILSALSLDFRLSVFAGVVAAAGYGTLTLIFREQLPFGPGQSPESSVAYTMRPILLLLCGVTAGLVAARIRSGILRSLDAAEERRRIVQMFGQHVSPAVVNQLLAQPGGLRSELRDVCILVLDIRNFTAFAETKAPDSIVNYLNQLWGKAVGIVNRHHGVVNKFLGDGFMAVFGAPLLMGNHCPECHQRRARTGSRNQARDRRGRNPSDSDRNRTAFGRGVGRQYRFYRAPRIHCDRGRCERGISYRAIEQATELELPRFRIGAGNRR